MTTKAETILQDFFKDETPYKDLAANATRPISINPAYPVPPIRHMGGSRIHTPKMTAALWGKPDHLTLSLVKTDVFDRRIVARKPWTVEQVTKGAFSEANREFFDLPYSGPVRAVWGVLDETGGRRETQAWSNEYAFPCQKPVGQIILQADGLETAPQPSGEQSMQNGKIHVKMTDEQGKELDLQYLLSMKRNVIAIHAAYQNLQKPISFRLYRSQDQAHRQYMDENGNFKPKEERRVIFRPADTKRPLEYYDYEADADINGPFEPPTSGSDGRFFWISQRFPAEPTFPEGFLYVMMGLVSDQKTSTCSHPLQKGLGTEPRMPLDHNGKVVIPKGWSQYPALFTGTENSYMLTRNAPGAAADACLADAGTGSVQAYFAVVTSNEEKDPLEAAKKMLLEAEAAGFAALTQENQDWYDALYDRREKGRIAISAPASDKARMDRVRLDKAFESWGISDGGFCDPDPRKYEGSEGYVNFDVDAQLWHSLPCYNEMFSEPDFVLNRYEPYLYFPRLMEAWHEGLIGKAKAIYDLPGLIIPHGYLPPIKPNPWYMENQTFDFCLDSAGQVLKVVWNFWDYAGDEAMLKEVIYPVTRDLAIFYEAFARRNYDGQHYNLIPVVETENWGISFQFTHTRNTTAAITLFRKILNCAIEAATLLGVDADKIPGWREVAENLPPYPIYRVSSGDILGGNPGAMPRWTDGDHPWFTGDYPATLADEITLDSSQQDKDMIARTNDVVRTDRNTLGYILVGKFKDEVPSTLHASASPIDNGEVLIREVTKHSERLINSRSGRIHLFPVVPDWSEIAFRDCLTRGGFSVSAVKDKEGVKAVFIKAKRSIPCMLMNPWVQADPMAIRVTDAVNGVSVPFEMQEDNGSCIVFQAQAGHGYSIEMTR